jgi:hypothetical protein
VPRAEAAAQGPERRSVLSRNYKLRVVCDPGVSPR